MKKPTKSEAIHNLVGGSITCVGNDVTYHDEQTPPSQEEIDAEFARMLAEYDTLDYARKRAAEYPSIAELTVALYDTDDKAAIDAKRAAVKAKYPKPS